MAANLLSEAGAVSDVFQRQFSLLKPGVFVESAKGLLRSRYHVLVFSFACSHSSCLKHSLYLSAYVGDSLLSGTKDNSVCYEIQPIKLKRLKITLTSCRCECKLPQLRRQNFSKVPVAL